MDMHPPTDLELESYPHVFFTSDNSWDPTSLDHEYSVLDMENITDEDHIPSFESHLVNAYGEIPIFDVNFSQVTNSAHDFNRFRPYFGYVPSKRIQKTLDNSTQFCRLDARLPLRKHF